MMARFKEYSYEQTVLLPVDYEKQLLPGTFEHTLNYLIDSHIDVDIFEKKYNNDETGAPAYDPRILLKLVLFAYSRGIFSSRKIAIACQENIVFRALTADTQPHFSTIAYFVSSLNGEALIIFQKILLICSELDLIGGEMFALDGCKTSSNASKEWSGTFVNLEKKKSKIEKTLKMLMEKHRKTDKKEKKDGKTKKREKKQVEKFKNKIEKIKRFLEENEPRMGIRGKEIQSNITDNESGKMKSGTKTLQGYNGHAVVDSKHQVIIHAEAFGSGNEAPFLQQMVEGAKQAGRTVKLGMNLLKNKIFISDTNLFSEKNLEYLKKQKIDAYIPDNHFRQRDPRFADADRHKPDKKKRYSREDFVYDKKRDEFICPNGKSLIFKREQEFSNNRGSHYLYQTSRADCGSCSLRDKCLRNENTRLRSIYIAHKHFNRNYSEEMMEKIDAPAGRDMYSKRMGIVEPVFGNISYNKGLNRFTLRSKVKVDIQWTFYCLVHNIEKIARYGIPDTS